MICPDGHIKVCTLGLKQWNLNSFEFKSESPLCPNVRTTRKALLLWYIVLYKALSFHPFSSKYSGHRLVDIVCMSWDTFPTWIFNLAPLFGQSGLFFQTFSVLWGIISVKSYLKFILVANSKNGAHLLNLMHRYTSPWMIKFRVSSQGDLQTSNDQIKINVLPSTRLLWDFFFDWYFDIKESKGNKKNLYISK